MLYPEPNVSKITHHKINLYSGIGFELYGHGRCADFNLEFLYSCILWTDLIDQLFVLKGRSFITTMGGYYTPSDRGVIVSTPPLIRLTSGGGGSYVPDPSDKGGHRFPIDTLPLVAVSCG